MTGRTLLALVLVVSALAGCSQTAEYSTSVSEPTNGGVIDNISIYDINEMDGARYRLNYSLAASINAAYNIEVYELTDGSVEFISVSDLDRREPVHRNDLPPPWNAGEERTYEIRVVRESNNTVVDAVIVTVKRDDT